MRPCIPTTAAATSPTACATSNEEDVDTVLCTIEVGKRQRTRGKEADFPVVWGYGDRLVRIVDDFIIAGVSKFGDGVERDCRAVVSRDNHVFLSSLTVSGDGNSPCPACKPLKHHYTARTGVLGLRLAVLGNSHSDVRRGCDGKGAACAAATSINSANHALTPPFQQIMVGIVIADSGALAAYRYTPPL